MANVLGDPRVVTGSTTVIDRYEYVELVARRQFMMMLAGRLRDVRLAYVDNPETADPRHNNTTVRRHHGIDLMATNDMAEAQNWLGVPSAS